MMEGPSGTGDTIIRASLGRHLAFAPVAFAVTKGPAHSVVYANALFRQLQSAGEITIGSATSSGTSTTADLTPVLDRVFQSAVTERDAVLETPAHRSPTWTCTVWPVLDTGSWPERLVVEVRDVELVEGAKARQRAIAERLLLSALREQDVTRHAEVAQRRAEHLAKVSRDLSVSLDEAATRDTVRNLRLPREGTWCIVDVVESNGAVSRLAVVHPDPAKQALAHALEKQWPAKLDDGIGAPIVLRAPDPMVVTHDSGTALMLAAHGEDNLCILDEIGFGSLLVVPLIVRGGVQGAITFVSRAGEAPFTPDEVALGTEIASRCALALDNARLYRQADALRVAAQLANKSKSDFLSSMSHELRTPLNAIGGFAELIDLGIQGPVTDEQHDALARIKSNQEHLLALISEILNFVRLESGRVEYRYTPVSLMEALSAVSQMLGGIAREKGLTLEAPRGDANVVAWADRDRVRQILVNLVMNAVKYAATNGGTIALACEVVGETVRAHVVDTGPGIEPEKLEAIFQPFVQLKAGLTERRGGVGLGLAISRDLARAMKGNLTVESTVGAGSRFTLSLPRHTSPH